MRVKVMNKEVRMKVMKKEVRMEVMKKKRRRVGHLITQAKLEIREGKNVKTNEKIIDELNGLEDVEAGAKCGEQEEDDDDDEEEEPNKKRKRAPPKRMSEGASSSAQPPKRGRGGRGRGGDVDE
ncbi:uncharacterized protein LOC113279553 [Papaver somniferum]|uniref:uncharacterized protein LOC113279553 n=1 Tax=Papaver somniferum TaxID=3469 RepID=UPI000E6FECA6|nr:uncharacterized protein LOC113279553 [Papaver somniferum]